MTLSSSLGPTAGGLGPRISRLHQVAHALWDQRLLSGACVKEEAEYLDAVAALAGWLSALHAWGATDEPHLAPALDSATTAAEAVVAAEAAGAEPSQADLGALLFGIDRLQAALRSRRRGHGDALLIDH